MSERATLRGSRLGGTSFEDESGIEFAPRQRDGSEPELKAEKPARTHWDMLLERRSITELEDILSERLELLRAGAIGPAHLHRTRTSSAKAKKSA